MSITQVYRYIHKLKKYTYSPSSYIFPLNFIIDTNYADGRLSGNWDLASYISILYNVHNL